MQLGKESRFNLHVYFIFSVLICSQHPSWLMGQGIHLPLFPEHYQGFSEVEEAQTL